MNTDHGRVDAAMTRHPFERILGQRSALGVLMDAMSSDRVHHAWIFHGPLGVGKRTTAEAFAAAALDPTTKRSADGEFTLDAASESQRLIAHGGHPDLHIITKELALYSSDPSVRSRKLMSIPRQVVEERLLAPCARASNLRLGGLVSKVFLVDEAELLSAESQNLLLKTLEEPPPGTVVVLITSALERLLPTIRSRCQRVAFEPLDDAEMSEWLGRIESDESASPVDEQEEAWIRTFASGSPGKAKMAMDGELSQWAKSLEPMLGELERGVFPTQLGASMAKLVDEWAKREVDRRPNSSKDAANKTGARLMLSFLAQRATTSLHRAASRSNADAEVEVDRALRWIDLIAQAERQLASNVNLALLLENLAAQLAAAQADASPVR